MRRRILLALGIAVLAASCGRASPGAAPVSDLSADVVLERIASVPSPVAFATRPGDGRPILYVASQNGIVHRIDLAAGTTTVAASFADATKAAGEQGLLGLAFSRSGDELYAHFTDLEGDTTVVAAPFADGRADVVRARVLLKVDQPYANHNGGQLLVDDDGNLLIGLGDGGSGGDPLGNAQNRSSLLGKILRITPAPSSSATPYTIPEDNPFVGSSTTRPEILFLGLRNPWRFSIDAATGDFWIADVGQNRFEEIDQVPRSEIGSNFGWDVKEGTHAFEGTTSDTLTDPIHEWRNVGGSAAIGGFVYRGSAIPSLQGKYVFADLAQPGLQVLDPSDRSVKRLDVPIDTVVCFGEDDDGALYVLSLSSGVYRLRSTN